MREMNVQAHRVRDSVILGILITIHVILKLAREDANKCMKVSRKPDPRIPRIPSID